MTEQAHQFFNALLKADSIIRASGRRIDVTKFIITYRDLYAKHESANPRGAQPWTKELHARNRDTRKQYLTENADRPMSEIAAGLGVTEKTAVCLFSKLGVKRIWRN